MLYVIFGLVVLTSIGLAAYGLIKKSELAAQVSTLQVELDEMNSEFAAEIDNHKAQSSAKTTAHRAELREQASRHLQETENHRAQLARHQMRSQAALQEQADRHSGESHILRAEISSLDKFKHIPGVIEKYRGLADEIEARLTQAQAEADETALVAHKDAERIKSRIAARLAEAEQRANDLIMAADREAERIKQRLIEGMDSDAKNAKELLRVAEWQAEKLVEDAQVQPKQIASQARKEAKEKTQRVDEIIVRASAGALEIREKAEARAREISGQAYEALRQYEFYESAAQAKRNVIEGYADTYTVPASHVLDELAEEFGFHKAGERLKLARDRTRVMEKGGLAATCNYPEGWKREYAVSFVLSAFNGKVDSILARLKPANQGKLIQEIKDVFALANHNGGVFKNARIHEEFLDARLEELKWAVAVQRVKEKEREEQRAIREQIRDEEKARKERERLVKQSEREQESVARAIERTRQEYEAANAENRLRLEAKLQDLASKLSEAEEKNRRAMSMAQQTKCGHVYVISNIGSFGEDVFKIGLTRRLEPLDRVKELGDASVPFSFDVHALIRSDDAPALETALHRRFLQNQVNKVNRRKEFFRMKLADIRSVIDELAPEVKWTMKAEARDYHDSLTMERHLQEDPGFRQRWAESEADYEQRHMFDDDEAEHEDQEVAASEEYG